MPSLLRKPPALKPGGHIRVLSLSSSTGHKFPRRFERGLQALRDLGYEVSEGRCARTAHYHMAGTPEERAQDLVSAWFDSDVDMILSVIGGHSANHLLEHAPLGKMAEAPKLLCGYSDLTPLLAALYSAGRLSTLYGPALLPQFGEAGGLHPYVEDQFQAAVSGAAPLGDIPRANGRIRETLRWDRDDTRPRNLEGADERRTLRGGTASGPLFVANMGALLVTAGTPHFPALDDHILVFEDDEVESPATVDRYLTQLRHLGVFDRAVGLVVCRFPDAVGMSEDALDDMIYRATAGSQMPIMAGFESGHVDPIATLPIGVAATLNADQTTLSIDECGVTV